MREKGPASEQDRDSFEEEISQKQAPGRWRIWFRGQDSKGGPIEGAKTWTQRADAYDEHMQRRILGDLEARRLQARQETADLGQTLRQKAMNAARMLVAVEQSIGADAAGREIVLLEVKLKPSDIARLAEVGVELERLALGESTENVDHNLSGFIGVGAAEIGNLAELSDEELEERIVKLAEINRRFTEAAQRGAGPAAGRKGKTAREETQDDDPDG